MEYRPCVRALSAPCRATSSWRERPERRRAADARDRARAELREEGISVLLVEQNAAFAVDVADVTHVMHQGTIVHSSAPEALWKNEEIKTQYLGVPGGKA